MGGNVTAQTSSSWSLDLHHSTFHQHRDLASLPWSQMFGSLAQGGCWATKSQACVHFAPRPSSANNSNNHLVRVILSRVNRQRLIFLLYLA